MVARDLSERGARVRVLPATSLPIAAYDESRDQYRADLLLYRARGIRQGDRVLAVADRDLYVGALNFVFGLADAPGRAAIISLHRLRSTDAALFRRRVLTEAIHELGHTFGLSHCVKSSCVMYFSTTLRDTDRKGYAFCRGCATRLSRYGQPGGES